MPSICCEVGNWAKHHAFEEESILVYNICLPFLWLCYEFLFRGLSIFLAQNCTINSLLRELQSCWYSQLIIWQVKSVVLHTLNRARFSVAVDSFLETGMTWYLFGSIQSNWIYFYSCWYFSFSDLCFLAFWSMIYYLMDLFRASSFAKRRKFKRKHICFSLGTR